MARARVNGDSVALANALGRLVEDVGLKIHLRKAGDHLRKVAADTMAILRDALEAAHIRLEAREHAPRHCGDTRAVETSP